MTHDEIKELHSEFRSINNSGRFLERRMCPFGDECRYMYKCKYRHPCDIEEEKLIEQERLEEERKKRPLKESFGDPNDPFKGMYENKIDFRSAIQAGLKNNLKRKREQLLNKNKT
eukprot:UN25847